MSKSLSANRKCRKKPGKVEVKPKTSTSPPRPYTGFTIFFRLERTRIVQSTGIIDEEFLASIDPFHVDNVEIPRPAGYEGLLLPPYWYSSSHMAHLKRRRKHRKREVGMDLRTLNTTINASWRQADRNVKAYCERLAAGEREMYFKKTRGAKSFNPNINNNNNLRAKDRASIMAEAKQQPNKLTTTKQVAAEVTPNGSPLLRDVFTSQANQNGVVNTTASVSRPMKQQARTQRRNEAAVATTSMLMCTPVATPTATVPDKIPSAASEQLINANAQSQSATSAMRNGANSSAPKMNLSMIHAHSHFLIQSEGASPYERRAPCRALMPANENQDLSLSYHKELDAGRFASVRDWEEQYADTLVITLEDDNCETHITLNKELILFMQDIGM